jgi:hypothetical protein
MLSSLVGNSTKTVLRYNLTSKHFGYTFYDALISLYIFSDFLVFLDPVEVGRMPPLLAIFCGFL